MKKVLICDDDEGIIDVATIVLQEKGYSVISLTQAEAIYELVAEHNPDIILLDLWMPDLGGDEITKKLKSDSSTKHIPIILFSASKSTEETAKQLGADAFLCKPFDIDELEEMIATHILAY
jgi:CheY-like chemotaxis protein